MFSNHQLSDDSKLEVKIDLDRNLYQKKMEFHLILNSTII